MPFTITVQPSDEPVALDEAKRHLRRLDGDLDDEIASLIAVARDYAERFTSRTLRTSVTRVLKQDAWWRSEIRLPWPPLLTVGPVTYYDAANAVQTLAASNYHYEVSTEGFGRLVWSSAATLPAVYDRPDAISVTFTTGYAAATSIPQVAIQAIKTKLTELFGVGTEWELKAAKEATDRLLGLVDWTGYA